ncbi:MAG: META domain-containing protein [Prevotella sp.]
MRKTIAAVVMTGVFVIFTACKTTETQKTTGNIGGEWTISEIAGKKIVTPADAQEAFMNFDVVNRQVNAYTGCNRFFGAVELDTTQKTVSFDKMGATRMMCPDMTTETMLSETLPKISRYGFDDEGHLLLMGKDGTILVKLTSALKK